MSDALLELRDFGVALDRQVVLSEVSLVLRAERTSVLVGPVGAGKSLLVRTLVGLNDTLPSLRRWGQVSWHPSAGSRPAALVMQDSRFMTATVRENLVSALPDRARRSPGDQTAYAVELARGHECHDLIPMFDAPAVEMPVSAQRRLAILRGVVTGTPVLFLDEPTAGLTDEAARDVLELVGAIARERAVLLVTHRQDHARILADDVVVIAGGVTQEQTDAGQFFAAPRSAAGLEWLATGSCSVPSPGARPSQLAPGVAVRPLPPAASVVRPNAGPRDFYWLIPGELGGCPRPGLSLSAQADLTALGGLGIRALVSLEENLAVSPETAALAGIRILHVPVPDRHPPSLEQGQAICREIDEARRRGEAVAVHCLAGLGRTGTVLAAYLVHRGMEPLEALERVRAIRPRAVQTVEQAEFLIAFAHAVATPERTALDGPTQRVDTR